MECYERAIELNPSSAEAHFNLGCVIQDAGGDILTAMEQYQKALVIRPHFPEALAHLVYAKMHTCSWGESEQQDTSKLLQLLESQLSWDDDDGRVLPCVQPFHSLSFPLSLQEIQHVSSSSSVSDLGLLHPVVDR